VNDRDRPVTDEPWATVELTDVRSGETFRIADLAGRVVFVEPMAVWCINCLRQQRDVREALQTLNADEVVYLSLGIDPSEDASMLAAYADEHQFGWRFAVAPRRLSRALADAFSDQVLNPPSTPVIIIGRAGRVTRTDFGHKSVTRLIELAREHGAS
jgi:hypothetical protein